MLWTKKQVEILKTEYLKKEENYLSKILNKSPNDIRIKASKMKIHKLAQRRNIKSSPVEKQFILDGLLVDLYCRIKKKRGIFPKIYIKMSKEYPRKIFYYLNFSAVELFNLIKDHIHPSMKYKIGVIN